MMEENSNIFLIGDDALVYLIVPMHKKYSTTFVWGHPFSKHMYAFRETASAVALFQKILLNAITHMY